MTGPGAPDPTCGDRIALRGVRAHGYHGVHAEERESGQPFVVDVLLGLDLSPAGRSDDVADTVHYGDLAAQVVAVVEGEPVNLLETLAARVADMCLSHPLVQDVEVTVHKPQAPVGVPFDDVAVTVVRARAQQQGGVVRRVVLALGSNQGDRLAMLQGAVEALADTPDLEVLDVSTVYETEPVGGPEQPSYLNAVLIAEATCSARALLERAAAVEAALGRARDVRWGPRTLDVDVIAVGDERVDDPDLQVPHPRAARRAFVLVPWDDADPAAVLPGAGPVAGLLAELDTTGVRARPDLALTVPL